MAAGGIGPRANRRRPTPPTTCASAKAFPAWARRCTTSSATTPVSFITFTANSSAHEPRHPELHHGSLLLAAARGRRRFLSRSLSGDRSGPRGDFDRDGAAGL